MKLEEWRTEKKLTLTQLAKKFGAPHATVVRRWCLAKDHKDFKIPSAKYMNTIQEITMAAVTPNDFYR